MLSRLYLISLGCLAFHSSGKSYYRYSPLLSRSTQRELIIRNIEYGLSHGTLGIDPMRLFSSHFCEILKADKRRKQEEVKSGEEEEVESEEEIKSGVEVKAGRS